MSNDNLLTIGRRIMGARLLIIDEVSLLSCENLVEIHEILKLVMITCLNDPQRPRDKINDAKIEKNIQTLPFAGLHVLFSGYK